MATRGVGISCANIITELKQLAEKDSRAPHVLNAIKKTIVHKIKMLPELNAPDAIDIVETASMFGDSVLTAISDAVDVVLDRTTTGQTPSPHEKRKDGPSQQVMDEPLQLFHTELMDKLLSQRTTDLDAEEYLAKHFRELGCVNPDVQTRGWAAAILAYSSTQRSCTFPKYEDIYETVKRFGQLVKSFRSESPIGPAKYPSNVDDLPKAVFNVAFGEGERAPRAYDLPRVRQIFKYHVPLRSTSKLLPRGFRDEPKSNRRDSGHYLKDDVSPPSNRCVRLRMIDSRRRNDRERSQSRDSHHRDSHHRDSRHQRSRHRGAICDYDRSSQYHSRSRSRSWRYRRSADGGGQLALKDEPRGWSHDATGTPLPSPLSGLARSWVVDSHREQRKRNESRKDQKRSNQKKHLKKRQSSSQTM